MVLTVIYGAVTVEPDIQKEAFLQDGATNIESPTKEKNVQTVKQLKSITITLCQSY